MTTIPRTQDYWEGFLAALLQLDLYKDKDIGIKELKSRARQEVNQ